VKKKKQKTGKETESNTASKTVLLKKPAYTMQMSKYKPIRHKFRAPRVFKSTKPGNKRYFRKLKKKAVFIHYQNKKRIYQSSY